MRISIIIPTCNRPEDLSRCLHGVHLNYTQMGVANGANDTGPHIEVIVTNDGNETDAYHELKRTYPYVQWLNGPKKGPASNRNFGARAASGDWLVFLDDDCVPHANWIEAFFKTPPDASVLEGKTIADRERASLSEESPVNETGGYLWSCNFAIKRVLFDKLKGFDESFPSAAMEDVDFRERIRTQNETIVFVQDAIVVHPWRPAKGWRFERKRVQSWEYLVSKHPHMARRTAFRNYAYMGIRGLLKETLPGALRFKGKGISHAVMINLYHLILSAKYLLRLRRDPTLCKK